MPNTVRQYWLLDKCTIRATNKQGETCTLYLYPGESITITRPKDSPIRKGPPDDQS